MSTEIKKHFEPTAWNIEISSDDDLFKLFSRIIEPVSRLEELSKKKKRIEKENRDASGTLVGDILSGVLSALGSTIKWAIPFAIVFVIVTNLIHTKDGTSWFKLYENMTNEMAVFDWLSGLMDKITEMGFIFTFVLGLLLIIVSAVLGLCILPGAMFLFPVLTVIYVIVMIFAYKSDRKTLEKNSVLLAEIQEEMDFLVDDLEMPLYFVPPDYRYSEAIMYFCNSYLNGKASSLKEAVILYDNFLHQQRMEQGQEEISYKQNKILDELNYQNQQLDSMQREIDDVRRTADSVYWRV